MPQLWNMWGLFSKWNQETDKRRFLSISFCSFSFPLFSLTFHSLIRSWRLWFRRGWRRTGWWAWQWLGELLLRLEVKYLLKIYRHSIDYISSVLLDFAKTFFLLQALLDLDLPLQAGKPWKSKTWGRDSNKSPRCKTEKTEQGRDNCKSPRCELCNENPPVEDIYKDKSDNWLGGVAESFVE